MSDMDFQPLQQTFYKALQPRPLSWLIALFVGTFYALSIREGHRWGGDFSQYIHHAQRLAEGGHYLDIHYITSAFAFVSPPAYPPVFPLLLTPIYFLYGLDLNVLKLVAIASFSLSLLFIYKTFQSNLSRPSMIALLLLIGLNPYLWDIRDYITSDFSFLLFSFISLRLMQWNYLRLADNRDYTTLASHLWPPCLLGIVMYLAYGTREIGLVLPLTVLCYELVSLRRLTRVSLLSISIFLSLAVLQHYSLQGYHLSPEIQLNLENLPRTSSSASGHADFFTLDINLLIRQIKNYADALTAFWLPLATEPYNSWQTLSWIFFWGSLLLAGFGYIKSLVRGITVLEIFPAGYLAVLLLFGGFQGIRYMIPLLPFMLYYAMLGFSSIELPDHQRAKSIAAFLAGIAIFSLYGYSFYTHKGAKLEASIDDKEAIELWAYIEQSTQPDDTFVFQKPRVLSLLTQRNASPLPRDDSAEFLLQYMNAIEGDYLIISNFSYKGVPLKTPPENIAINTNTEAFFTSVLHNDLFTVYRYTPPATRIETSPEDNGS